MSIARRVLARPLLKLPRWCIPLVVLGLFALLVVGCGSDAGLTNAPGPLSPGQDSPGVFQG